LIPRHGGMVMLSDFRGTNPGFSPGPRGEPSSCLGRSCLKWGDDGELSPLDLQGILERLCAVDEQAASQLLECQI
jgi:hypothetical protein